MAEPAVEYYLSFDALNPHNGKHERPVHITQRRAEHIATRGSLHLVEMNVFVGKTLGRPTAVYEGVRIESSDSTARNNWTCYVSAPSPQLMGPMHPMRPEQDGDLFLVFVNAENIAYSWRWEKPDPKRPGTPKDAEQRFAKRIM